MNNIIAVHYHAVKFITTYGGELFPGVPVVFTGVTKHTLSGLAIDNELMTGISSEIDFGKVFETM